MRLDESIQHLRAEVDELEAGAEPAPTGILVVVDAVKVLGISRTLLDQTIKDAPPSKRPATLPTRNPDARRHRYYWPDVDALRAWWAERTAPPAARERPSRPTPKKVASEVVEDWGAVARGTSKR